MMPSAAAIQAHLFTYINAFVLWLNIIAFAVFQGSDSGAGILYTFARGPLAERQRESLGDEIGPLWEANETWSVFLVTGIFTTFPAVFYTLVVGLFYPLTVALLGLVFFGAAFEFYRHAPQGSRSRVIWRWVFTIASWVTPFVFGAAAGAVASGDLHYVHGHVTSDYWSTWTHPFALAVGFFAVGICMTLAATFQTADSQKHHDEGLLPIFRRQAVIVGAFTALIGAVAAGLSIIYAPHLWANLITRALPLTLAAVLDGLLVAAALLFGYFRASRMLVVGEVALILGAWGIAQFPYFIPPDLTIENTAAQQPVQIAAFVTGIIGIFLFMPAFYYLIYLFHGPARLPKTSALEWATHNPEVPFEWSRAFGLEKTVPPAQVPAEANGGAPSLRGRVAKRLIPLAGIAAASAALTLTVTARLRHNHRDRMLT